MNDSKLSSFQVCEKLGEGTFGKIYRIKNPETNEEFAMKVEDPKKRRPRLLEEALFYSQITKNAKEAFEYGVPRVHCTGEGKGYNYMVMDLMGPSLEDLFKKCNRRFSLKTVLMISVQLLITIKYIHSKGILHRDLKPHNFVIGLKGATHRIFMIDLGLSKIYIENGEIIKYREDKSMTGTVRYASISNQKGYEQSRRDDLETLAYNLIYFLRGNLPWQNTKGKSKQEKYKRILAKKESSKIEDLCLGLPSVFPLFLKYCRSLSYSQQPDYDYWIRQFYEELTARQHMVFDYSYDWKSVMPTLYTPPIFTLPEPPVPFGLSASQMMQETTSTNSTFDSIVMKKCEPIDLEDEKVVEEPVPMLLEPKFRGESSKESRGRAAGDQRLGPLLQQESFCACGNPKKLKK